MSLNLQTIDVAPNIAAVITTDSKKIFDYEDVAVIKVNNSRRGIVPWGEENDLPDLILEKIRASDVMSPNMHFNILTGYGNGIQFSMEDGGKLDEKIKVFLRRNNMTKYMLEHLTDMKHFYFAVSLIFLTKDQNSIAKIKHKEAFHCRFELNDPKTGKIERVFSGNWKDDPKGDHAQVYEVLDQEDPYFDLMIKLGKEIDPRTGKTQKATNKTVFAIVTRMPISGHKYYPFPYYASHFNSGWYDISTMIPLAKRAKMANGMLIKYQVEIHKDYFDNLYATENITDPDKKTARRKTEFNNIKDFLGGIENAGKVWFSGYYIDPNGKENRMIRITLLDTKKEGGDWIEDAEEAANQACYAMGVHPSLIGAVPGKSKGSFSGTDKRELFTMKQSLEKPFRDLALIPFEIIREFNNWSDDLIIDIPHMLLTTLDKGSDAKEVTQIPKENDSI